MERRKWKGMKRLMYLEAEVSKETDDEAIDDRRRGCGRNWQKQTKIGR